MLYQITTTIRLKPVNPVVKPVKDIRNEIARSFTSFRFPLNLLPLRSTLGKNQMSLLNLESVCHGLYPRNTK